MARGKVKVLSSYEEGIMKGRLAAWRQLPAVVAAIEADINRRSGLSPMLWADREKREEITKHWLDLAEGVITR